MSKTFTFAKLTKMGDFDDKYGQRYWGEPNEQLVPVMFNSMNQNITAEDTIEAEEILLKTSGKGVDYHGLKKVRVVQGSPASTTPNAPALAPAQEGASFLTDNPRIKDQLDRIEAKLDQILKLTQLEVTDNTQEHIEAIQGEEW